MDDQVPRLAAQRLDHVPRSVNPAQRLRPDALAEVAEYLAEVRLVRPVVGREDWTVDGDHAPLSKVASADGGAAYRPLLPIRFGQQRQTLRRPAELDQLPGTSDGGRPERARQVMEARPCRADRLHTGQISQDWVRRHMHTAEQESPPPAST